MPAPPLRSGLGLRRRRDGLRDLHCKACSTVRLIPQCSKQPNTKHRPNVRGMLPRHTTCVAAYWAVGLTCMERAGHTCAGCHRRRHSGVRAPADTRNAWPRTSPPPRRRRTTPWPPQAAIASRSTGPPRPSGPGLATGGGGAGDLMPVAGARTMAGRQCNAWRRPGICQERLRHLGVRPRCEANLFNPSLSLSTGGRAGPGPAICTLTLTRHA